jgi:hypothetical protein
MIEPGLLLLAVRIAMAVSLYAFLGYASWLMWRQFRHPAPLKQDAPSLILSAAVPDPQRWQVEGAEATLGRSVDCDCRLDNPTVSSQHARLTYQNGCWRVEDLNSRNGTFVNEEAVHTPTALSTGDELRCGSIVLKVSLGGPKNSL